MYAIDIGNTFSVLYDGKNTKSVRSVLSPVRSPLNVRPGTGLIKFEDKLYHTGDAAFKYNTPEMLAQNDKQLPHNQFHSLLYILNLISNFGGKLNDYTSLIIQVPDQFTSYQHEIVSLLNGPKVWTLDGKQYSTYISVEQVYQEGYGSWYMAQRSGVVQDDGGYTLVVDLGGGTAIATLIDNEDGSIIRTYTYKHSGMVFLATLLCDDYDLRRENEGNVIRIEQIFEGFENGTLRIGRNGADFSRYVPEYSSQWWKHVWSSCVNDFRSQFASKKITKVLVTGGGTEVVRPFIRAAQDKPGVGKLFCMASEPLLENIKGIWYAYHEVR